MNGDVGRWYGIEAAASRASCAVSIILEASRRLSPDACAVIIELEVASGSWDGVLVRFSYYDAPLPSVPALENEVALPHPPPDDEPCEGWIANDPAFSFIGGAIFG